MSVTEPVPATREERRYLDFKDPTHGLYLDAKIIMLVGQRPISAGYSSVRCAHFEGNTEYKVAVKCLRYSSDEGQNKLMNQALGKEITVLKDVRHPSILPFLGLVPYGEWDDPCIVTPWMKNGSVQQYLKIHPDADRLAILTDVAIAVGYLHSGAGLPQTSFVIHGDIHAGNVLISDEGNALLADFGLSKRVLIDGQTSLSLRPVGRTPGLYLAPELRGAPDALRSRCSDVFAFGMLIYETYAGCQPNVPDDKLRSGQRPGRASIARSDVDEAWPVACECWAQNASDRPSMQAVCNKLKQARAKTHADAQPALARVRAEHDCASLRTSAAPTVSLHDDAGPKQPATASTTSTTSSSTSTSRLSASASHAFSQPPSSSRSEGSSPRRHRVTVEEPEGEMAFHEPPNARTRPPVISVRSTIISPPPQQRFAALISVMEAFAQRGEARPSRCDIAAAVGESFLGNGFVTFRGYSLAAEIEGIVRRSGRAGIDERLELQ